MRFGIGMNTDHTLEEVGQQFSVTRERIRQIEAKALRKLKHPSRAAARCGASSTSKREPGVAEAGCPAMLHHLSLGTADLDRARAFYDPVMAELGLRRTLDVADAVGYGAGHHLVQPQPSRRTAEPASPGNGVHVAFEVEHRAAVDAFHRVALAHGGTDDGPPGLRPEYDPNYYAAFVRDPDGNKIEAVTFAGA